MCKLEEFTENTQKQMMEFLIYPIEEDLVDPKETQYKT